MIGGKIPGLRYSPDVISTEEEASLIAMFESLDLPFRTSEGRSMICWGAPAHDRRWSIGPVAPVPASMIELGARCFGGDAMLDLASLQVLVTRYEAGGGIEKHRDAMVFAEPIVGLSIGADAAMRFEREGQPAVDVLIARRSVYSLSGEARSEWTHSIPRVYAVRWSVTFRSLERDAT